MNKKSQIILNYVPDVKNPTQARKDWLELRNRLDLRKAGLYQIDGPHYRHIVRFVSPTGRVVNIYAVYNVKEFLNWRCS